MKIKTETRVTGTVIITDEFEWEGDAPDVSWLIDQKAAAEGSKTFLFLAGSGGLKFNPDDLELTHTIEVLNE